MKDNSHIPVQRVGDLHAFRDMGNMPDLSIAGLASLRGNPDAMKMVPTKCNKCDCDIEAPNWTRFSCVCDKCREEIRLADITEKVSKYWAAICPPAFLDTKKDHPNYPKAQDTELREWLGGESLLMFGPSGAGKTRLAMQLLYRCLLVRTMKVGVLWPEQLKSTKWSHDRLELTQKWGSYEVLLMDDALLTGAQDEKIADFLKDLIDYMMRYKRIWIITSQIGGSDYEEQLEKFGEATKADKERVKALLRRIRDQSRVVPFVPVVPAAGEQNF